MCTVKISVHGALRFTALPVHTSRLPLCSLSLFSLSFRLSLLPPFCSLSIPPLFLLSFSLSLCSPSCSLALFLVVLSPPSVPYFVLISLLTLSSLFFPFSALSSPSFSLSPHFFCFFSPSSLFSFLPLFLVSYLFCALSSSTLFTLSAPSLFALSLLPVLFCSLPPSSFLLSLLSVLFFPCSVFALYLLPLFFALAPPFFFALSVVYAHIVTCSWTCAEPPTASPRTGPCVPWVSCWDALAVTTHPVRIMDRQSANSCVWVVRWSWSCSCASCCVHTFGWLE